MIAIFCTSLEAIQQIFSAILFALQNSEALSFESMDQDLKYDHSNESNGAVRCCGTVCFTVQCGCNFLVSG